MANIQIPTRDQVDTKAQGIFDQLKKQLGKVPNLYAAIGYSSDALENFLNFSGKAGAGTFSKKEIEAIKLAVSEVNGCEYCQAAHTALAKMAGFTEEETFALRTATVEDARLNAVTSLAKEIAENKGKASEATIDKFLAQGFDEKGLIDLIAVVTAITFTNYVHGTTKVAIDFPRAKALTSVTV